MLQAESRPFAAYGAELSEGVPSRAGTKSLVFSHRSARVRTVAGSFVLTAAIALCVLTSPKTTLSQTGSSKSDPPAKQKDKPKFDPKEFYGDQGGEKVAEANPRLPNTVLRARLEDTFLKLSDPRVGQNSNKRNALMVDYEVTSRGKFDGGFLVLDTDDGGRAEIALKSIEGRDHGTIELVGVQQFGNIKIARNANFPTDVEMYVVRGDDRYDPPSRFMVSNSVVMGKMKLTTRPRDWTTQEIERYTKAPPSYKNPNAYPDIGVDVHAVPITPGQMWNNRYVDPEGHLLGLDYMLGDWDKEKRLWRLAPVFSAEQPKQHTARLIARKGFAVAGAEVNAEKHISGIRLLYRKLKPDGTFDEKDAYASEWIGTPPTGEGKKLVNDGRKVLGINYQMGAIVDNFALVAEKEAK